MQVEKRDVGWLEVSQRSLYRAKSIDHGVKIVCHQVRLLRILVLGKLVVVVEERLCWWSQEVLHWW